MDAYLRAGLHYGGEVHRSWKERLLILIGRKCNSWPVMFTLGEENNGGELFSWMIRWHGRLRGGTFWSWASLEEEFLVRPQEAGQAQLQEKCFIAFNSSLAHPPFASYNHVLAKHSWPTGGLLHRSVNRPLNWNHYELFKHTNSVCSSSFSIRSMTCVVALFIAALKFSPSMIEIPVAFTLLMDLDWE